MKTEITDYHTISGITVGMYFLNPITPHRPRLHKCQTSFDQLQMQVIQQTTYLIQSG